MSIKAVIIDDEKDSREILANYLARYCPDVEVCAFGESVATGLKVIQSFQPSVVFLDVEMPYGNGFDLLEQIGNVNFEIVFVTAYNDYAIQALNQSAAYYLLKPINIDELIKAVDKIRGELSGENYSRHTNLLLENIKKDGPQKIMLPTMEGFEVINIDTIQLCEAVDNFTRFHIDGVQPLLICRTLKYFEEILQGYRFVRIHRSYIVNTEYVIRYTKGKGGFVTMKNGMQLEVSAQRKKEFMDRFEK